MDTQPQHGYPMNPPSQSQRGYEGPRYHQPGSAYPAGYTPPMPPKAKRKKWPWIVGGLVLLLVLCGVGSFTVLGLGAKAVVDEVEATKADVTLVEGSCKKATDGISDWQAQIKITNSSKTSDRSYMVQVNLDKGTTRLGEGVAIVNALKPGQTKTETVTGSGKLVKGATCSIGDVN